MAYEFLAENLSRVRDEIRKVQAVEGLTQNVVIVAVTKGHAAEAVRAAHRAGLQHVGENRVQEAVEKQKGSADVALRWHLIGHLQTNKAKLVPGAFVLVHSVDSWRIAEALAGATRNLGSKPVSVLLQVNVAGETQKSGCAPEEAAELAHRVAAEGSLKLEGLMAMAPLTGDERVQRRVFGDARRLREAIAATGVPLPELSMGMSGDYPAAVAEGATMLRLGTVLFGERQ